MTSIAETGGGIGRRHRVAWVVLALSLTLNVFFIGGWAWSRLTTQAPQTPAQRFEQLAHRLDLTAEQRAALQEFGGEVRQRTHLFHNASRPLMDQIWGELAKPAPDQALISRLIDEVAENRHTYQKDMAADLSRFLAALSPEQRATFVELAKQRQDQTGQRGWRLLLP